MRIIIELDNAHGPAQVQVQNNDQVSESTLKTVSSAEATNAGAPKMGIASVNESTIFSETSDSKAEMPLTNGDAISTGISDAGASEVKGG